MYRAPTAIRWIRSFRANLAQQPANRSIIAKVASSRLNTLNASERFRRRHSILFLITLKATITTLYGISVLAILKSINGDYNGTVYTQMLYAETNSNDRQRLSGMFAIY